MISVDQLPSKLHTFVDESYGSGQDDYYVGGIVVDEAQKQALYIALQELKDIAATRFGVVNDIEFHAYEIMHGVDGWACFRGRVHESIWLIRSILQAVVNSGARIHMQGVDVRRLNARYRYPDSPYRVTLRHLLERVHDECVRKNLRSTVTADIFDESDAATAAIAGFVRQPTPGYRPTRLCHIDPMDYVDSRTSLGVQAADVVAYILRRHLEEHSAHAKARKAARQLFETARPAFSSCRKWNP